MSRIAFLQDLLNTIADQGRALLPKSLVGDTEEGLQALVKALMGGRGEASGVAIARQLVKHYRLLDDRERHAFFRYLAATLKPDQAKVEAAARAYAQNPTDEALVRLQAAVESPRQEFFRRLNLAPGATAAIVGMRSDLTGMIKGDPALAALDADIRHLLQSWFNRGFLVLRRIDWNTPAAILEKIIAYEAVHEIRGWDDLRRRLDPADRRCFAFFHPNLVDEPLIFVEVALMHDSPEAISKVLKEARKSGDEAEDHEPTTAVFYSISNCQEGLKGISFGNFLIKQVAEELLREEPTLKTFVTLSPVPGFARWLARQIGGGAESPVTDKDREALSRLANPSWPQRADEGGQIKAAGMAMAAHYFLAAKTPDGKPVDPVARFHLGNGARLERINWLGDVSDKGLSEAHGLMVNYLYDLKEIEKNHEAYANEGTVAASRGVRALLRPPAKRPAASRDEPAKADATVKAAAAKADASAQVVVTAGPPRLPAPGKS